MPERKQAGIAVRAFASAKPPLFDIYLAWRLLGTIEAASTQEAAEAQRKSLGLMRGG
jgi:hypothetical protein